MSVNVTVVSLGTVELWLFVKPLDTEKMRIEIRLQRYSYGTNFSSVYVKGICIYAICNFYYRNSSNSRLVTNKMLYTFAMISSINLTIYFTIEFLVREFFIPLVLQVYFLVSSWVSHLSNNDYNYLNNLYRVNTTW